MTGGRLLLDEMISPTVARALRDRGLDVTAVAESPELRALPDAAVLEHARQDGRILVTRDVADFGRLHQQWLTDGRPHAGLVMVTEVMFPQNRNLVGALVRALAASATAAALPSPGEMLFLRPAPPA